MSDSKDLTFNEKSKEISETNNNLKSEAVLNVVINSLRGMFPGWRNAIKSTIELNNMKREWLKAFIENGIRTDTQINKGLGVARKSTSSFIPSIGQFIEWCRIPTTCTHIELDNLDNVKKVPTEELTDILNEKAVGYTSIHSRKQIEEGLEIETTDEEIDKESQYKSLGTYYHGDPKK